MSFLGGRLAVTENKYFREVRRTITLSLSHLHLPLVLQTQRSLAASCNRAAFMRASRSSIAARALLTLLSVGVPGMYASCGCAYGFPGERSQGQ